MKKSEGVIVSKTVCFSNGNYVEKDVSIPLQEGTPGLGMPVSQEAAEKMVRDYIEINQDNLDQNLSIEFGRETILSLLSQAGCESIRFYFCINNSGEKSLLAIPMSSNGALAADGLAFDNETGKSGFAEKVAGREVGGGKTIRNFIDENAIKLGDYLNSGNDSKSGGIIFIQ